MDEIRRSLAQLYEAKEQIAEALSLLADLAAHPQMDPDTRRTMVEMVYAYIDRIEELD